MQDLRTAFDQFCEDFEFMMAWHPANPLKAQVRLWDLPMRLAESGEKRQAAAGAIASGRTDLHGL